MVATPWHIWAFTVLNSARASTSVITKSNSEEYIVNEATALNEKEEPGFHPVKPDQWVRRTIDPKLEALMPKPRFGFRSEIPLPLSCLDRHSEGAVPVARVGEVFSKVTHWGATALFLAGVEGSSHHGIEKLIPELNMLCRQSRGPQCLRLRWESYPTKGSGMNEEARLSLLYGDSCYRNKGGWHSSCPQNGKWRCSAHGDDDGGVGGQGRKSSNHSLAESSSNDEENYIGSNDRIVSRNLNTGHNRSVQSGNAGDFSSSSTSSRSAYGPTAELMYSELLWRFGTWPHWFTLSSPSMVGFKVVLLKRNFLRSIVSHNPKAFPWDGGIRSHALVLAACTTLLSAMLSEIPSQNWVSIDPDTLGHPILGLATLQQLVRWFEWPMPPNDDLQKLLQRVWIPSSKQPNALLSPSDLQFAQQLIATRRADGSWKTFDNPKQTLLYSLLAALKPIAPDWDWSEYEVVFVPHNSTGSMQDQSVRLPLNANFRGPFPNCRPPDFAKLDPSWPRDNGTTPAEAEAWALTAAARKDELRRRKEQKLARRQSSGQHSNAVPHNQRLGQQKR